MQKLFSSSANNTSGAFNIFFPFFNTAKGGDIGCLITNSTTSAPSLGIGSCTSGHNSDALWLYNRLVEAIPHQQSAHSQGKITARVCWMPHHVLLDVFCSRGQFQSLFTSGSQRYCLSISSAKSSVGVVFDKCHGACPVCELIQEDLQQCRCNGSRRHLHVCQRDDSQQLYCCQQKQYLPHKRVFRVQVI